MRPERRILPAEDLFNKNLNGNQSFTPPTTCLGSLTVMSVLSFREARWTS